MMLPLDSTTTPATRSRIKNTGTSQYFFRASMKRRNSRKNFMRQPRLSIRIKCVSIIENQIGILPVLVEHAIPDQQHVGARRIEVEPIMRVFGENGRRKGAEALAVLDLQIECFLRLGRARVRQDRTIAEGARAELHPSLEPPDRLALRERLCGLI